jgi:hypothetical protein
VSYKSLHTLSDCEKHGAMLLVTCGCGREVWKAPGEFMRPRPGVRKLRGWVAIDQLGLVLRCRCGRKGTRVTVSIDYRVPAGVPVAAFLNADDRERKRMIRIARG